MLSCTFSIQMLCAVLFPIKPKLSS